MRKVLSLLILIAVFLTAASTPALADHVPVPDDPGTTYTYTGSNFTLTENGTTYTYKIYASSVDYYKIYTNLYCCAAVYHAYNGGSFTIKNTIPRTNIIEGIKIFNENLNYNVVTSTQLTKLVSCGYGLSVTISSSFDADTVEYHPGSNAPTGYYRIFVLYDYHAFKLRKYNGSSLIASIDAVAPIGEPYLALARKATSSGTYIRYAV